MGLGSPTNLFILGMSGTSLSKLSSFSKLGRGGGGGGGGVEDGEVYAFVIEIYAFSNHQKSRSVMRLMCL